jgi:hypothetical protein
MALHYFHIANGKTTLDRDGTDLPDAVSVRTEAVQAARELLNLGQSEGLWNVKPWKVFVTNQPDGGGKVIATIEVTASWLA